MQVECAGLVVTCPKFWSCPNKSYRIITRCPKSTNSNCLYLLAGIDPSDIRREVASKKERYKAIHDPSHMLYGSEAAQQQLKSRKSFLFSTHPLDGLAEETGIKLPKKRLKDWPPNLTLTSNQLRCLPVKTKYLGNNRGASTDSARELSDGRL